jgi:hypothetical protein
MIRNNRAKLTAGLIHPFFVAISLGTRVCIYEKWDEAADCSSWHHECARHFGTVHAPPRPVFQHLQFQAGHPSQCANRRMLTRADLF